MNVYLVCRSTSPWTRDGDDHYPVIMAFASEEYAWQYAEGRAERECTLGQIPFWIRSGSTSSLRDQDGRRTGWYVEEEPIVRGAIKSGPVAEVKP